MKCSLESGEASEFGEPSLGHRSCAGLVQSNEQAVRPTQKRDTETWLALASNTVSRIMSLGEQLYTIGL